VTFTVLGDTPDTVAADTRRSGGIADKVLEAIPIAVVPIETAIVRPDPQDAPGIFEQAIDVIVRNGERIMSIVPVDSERITVKLVQAILCTQPDESLMILEGATYLGL
jgi:hypothetical protein